jgi:hypothetical protein
MDEARAPRMTDSELLAAQHRVILNMPCSCKLAWKHSAEQPLCERCRVLEIFLDHTPSNGACVHGIGLGRDCIVCPRGIAQVWERIA